MVALPRLYSLRWGLPTHDTGYANYYHSAHSVISKSCPVRLYVYKQPMAINIYDRTHSNRRLLELLPFLSSRVFLRICFTHNLLDAFIISNRDTIVLGVWAIE